MSAAAVKEIEKTLRGLGGEDDLLGIGQLLVSDPDADRVVIDNTMDSEMEANIIASVISKDEIKGLCLVNADKSGREVLMKDDYLPFVGRFICRLAHEAGYKVYVAMPNPCRQPEAVIVTSEGMYIQLLSGEKRQKDHTRIDPDFIREQVNERVACINGT